MAKFTTSTYRKQASITSSIAFLPSIITTAFFLLALVMLYFETTPYSTAIEKRLPFDLVRDKENARIILSTLAASTISLTVFSFSMVMIVLSQASSNLSPRVIPGLTTARPHQLVLGFYIGTIIYIFLLLLSYKPDEKTQQTPAIAILIGLLLGIVCLILFVYFIHSVSKAIQVDNILNTIFLNATQALNQEEKAIKKTHAPANFQNAAPDHTLKNDANGYLKQIDLSALQQLATKHQVQLEILVEVGGFAVEGTPLLNYTNSPLPPEAQKELQGCFTFSQEEVVMKDYEQGVKQISEIAVKALSPGINDPGTAQKAIDFLTLLFIRRLKCTEHNCLLDEQQQVRVIDKTVTLNELMTRYLSPIRTYGKGDLQINIRLLKCFENMLHQQPAPEQVQAICSHATAVLKDADKAITNPLDRELLNEAVARLNILLKGVQLLAPLK